MARMMIVRKTGLTYYPDGVYEAPKLSTSKSPPEYWMEMRHYEALLVDEGGEYQQWGRCEGDPPGKFLREVYREKDEPRIFTRIMRWSFRRRADYFDKIIPKGIRTG